MRKGSLLHEWEADPWSKRMVIYQLCLLNRLTFLVSSPQVLFDILYRIDLAKFQARVVMKYIWSYEQARVRNLLGDTCKPTYTGFLAFLWLTYSFYCIQLHHWSWLICLGLTRETLMIHWWVFIQIWWSNLSDSLDFILTEISFETDWICWAQWCHIAGRNICCSGTWSCFM